MEERRRATPPRDLSGFLHTLPARVLLDRLPTAMLGVGLAGDIVYANPVCAELLGRSNADSITRLRLPELLVGQADCLPSDCVTTLRNAESTVKWHHFDGYVIRTTVSASLLMRESDPLLLVCITDVTHWLWAAGSKADRQEAAD